MCFFHNLKAEFGVHMFSWPGNRGKEVRKRREGGGEEEEAAIVFLCAVAVVLECERPLGSHRPRSPISTSRTMLSWPKRRQESTELSARYGWNYGAFRLKVSWTWGISWCEVNFWLARMGLLSAKMTCWKLKSLVRSIYVVQNRGLFRSHFERK